MNKRRLILTLTIALACLSTGCGNKIPDMTEVQQHQVCEYAAQLLISHDKFHDRSFVDQDTIELEKQKLENAAAIKIQIEADKEAKRKEKEEKKKEKENKESKDNEPQVSYADIDEFLGLDGINIEYAGMQVCDSYPVETATNDWQGISRASNGNKLVVYKFDITNETSADYYLDIASLKTRVSFKINGNISKAALTTLLSDDLIMYRNIIASGEKSQAVVLVEMSEDDSAAINSTVMKIKYKDSIAEKTLL